MILDVRYEDLNVQLLDMELGVHEQIVKNSDDTFTIFINTRYSSDSQIEAFNHALEHIRNDDYEKTDVQLIELEAHSMVIQADQEQAAPLIPPYVKKLRGKQMTPEEFTKKIERRIRYHKREQQKEEEELKLYQEKRRYMPENCDAFASTEHGYLYGKDL